ncbi:MAG: monofunctional biosynthetic peptidoglycan transglycosylase [Deltaproteobacteria bacterium]|nr:monofunctional biosynthetic peptidoglycan transglycosylase [Deltaproteobacteria bacterium]
MSFLKLFAIFLLSGLIVAGALYLALLPITSFRFVNPGRTALMMERGGKVDQVWVPLSRISTNLRRAVVVAEDGNFLNHHGIDFQELKASFEKNMKRQRFARGFSTLTMQLAKNLYLSPQKTLLRKTLEVLIALRMEQILSKERILELYLNVVEWGDGIYGAEAAARYYFQKPASGLSAGESAFLAAILPNPRRWGDWPPSPAVRRRQQVILTRLGIGEKPVTKTAPPEEAPEIPELPEEENGVATEDLAPGGGP